MLKEELASFAEFFEGYADQFAVLGGAACSQWFGEASLEFRQTKDLDIVLILEAKSREFSPTIAMDLNRFLDLYQPSASAWEGISQSLYDSGFEMRSPAELINLIRKCYRQ